MATVLRNTTNRGPEKPGAEPSLDDLMAAVQEIQNSNAVLKKENFVLESYLNRKRLPIERDLASSDPDSVHTLSLEQKFFIANSELKDTAAEIDKAKAASEKYMEQLRSLREETEIRISEMKKEAYEFRRDIVSGALNTRTGKIMAEKVIKYFEDKLRAKDNLVEKLQAKNVALKLQAAKLEAQLQHKEQLGELLLPIDFEQLKIENQQYQQTIELRNADLLSLKITAGTTHKTLSNHKKKLYALSIEHDQLRSEISSKRDALAKLTDEQQRVASESAQVAVIKRKLRGQLDDYRVPEVLAYVKLNAELAELAKHIRDWQRKLDIAHLSHRKAAQLVHQRTMAMASVPPMSAAAGVPPAGSVPVAGSTPSGSRGGPMAARGLSAGATRTDYHL
eukprot:TRINITY_DN931_c1_g1_i1.p1 TRINITY_DN931_c1_g1~~TRINITY_DN931_c1_g1_i1.p1  ORF type:complete len:393 (-),score=164.51 TRINITY_DN931_c1_g1_i1:228-1406(-)